MRKLISTPVITLTKRNGQFTLDTDACNRRVGCVLPENQEDRTDRPIGYWLRTLSESQKSLDSTLLEFLAAVLAVLPLRPYLEGAKLITITDHNALRSTLNIADATRKLERWCLRLMEADFEVNRRARAEPRLRKGYRTFKQMEQIIRKLMMKFLCCPFSTSLEKRNTDYLAVAKNMTTQQSIFCHIR